MSFFSYKNAQNEDPEVLPSTSGIPDGWSLVVQNGEPVWSAGIVCKGVRIQADGDSAQTFPADTATDLTMARSLYDSFTPAAIGVVPTEYVDISTQAQTTYHVTAYAKWALTTAVAGYAFSLRIIYENDETQTIIGQQYCDQNATDLNFFCTVSAEFQTGTGLTGNQRVFCQIAPLDGAAGPTCSVSVFAFAVHRIASDASIPTPVSGVVSSLNQGVGIVCSPNPIVSTGTISLGDTAVTPGSYGSSTLVPVLTVDQQGRITAASTAAVSTGGSITVTGSTFLTVSGSPVSLGGTVTLTNTALNDYFGTGCWGAGNSISFGAGSTYTVLVGNSCSSVASVVSAVAIGQGSRAGGSDCISIGNLAGAAASVGPKNVYVGTSTGAANNNATGLNVFLGYQAGQSQTSCANSVIIGGSAASAGGTTSSQTVCIGSNTTIRDSSVIIGHSASAGTTRSTVIGWSATATQSSDVAIGDGAGVSGARSVGIGSSASSTGADDVAIGNGSKTAGTSVSIGSGAGSTTTTVSVCVGYQCGSSGAGAITAVGYRAARGAAASNGTFIGYQAGLAVTGVGNTCLGLNAGATTLTTGTNNVLIGNGADTGAAGTGAGVAIGASAVVGGSESVIVGFNGISSGTDSTALGGRASATNTATLALGWTSSANSLNSSAVGANASASAASASCFGQNSTASGTNSTSIGQGSSTTASYANAFGVGVANSTASTTLIGDGSGTPSAHVVKSTGFFRSNQPYSCQAGRTNGTTQTVTLPGPTTLTIANTPWDAIGGSVSGNTILVQDNLTWFRVIGYFSVNAFTSVGANQLVMKLHYYDGTTDNVVSASSYSVSAASTEAFVNVVGYFKSTASAGQYVYADMTRYGGGTTSAPVVNYYTLTLERCV